MKKIALIIILLFFVLLAGKGVTAESRKIPIAVQVFGEDMCKPLVESYIKRELRALGDVVIARKPPAALVLRITCLPAVTKDGTLLGVVVHATLLQPISDEIMEYILEIADVVRSELTRQSRFRLAIFIDDHLEIGSLDDLKNSCSRIVANFDIEHIEMFRKTD